jgi:hypothetical protein
MELTAPTCALCGKTVGGDEPAHAVRDKVICEECRRLVLATGPRPVLAYAGGGGRRRRWVWPAVAAGVFVAGVLVSLVFTAQHAAERARAEQMRALLAEQRARAAVMSALAKAEDAARARPAETRPAE